MPLTGADTPPHPRTEQLFVIVTSPFARRNDLRPVVNARAFDRRGGTITDGRQILVRMFDLLVDTMYRDVYLGRARALLSPVVSLEAFHGMEQRRSELASLPLAVARALERADWPQVRELSLRADAVKQEISREGAVFETARGVYAATDVKLDPFSQSLQRFSRVSAKDLPALRARVVEQLSTLA